MKICKDWLSWYVWISFIVVAIEVWTYRFNWVRWKWGYWNLDLIPAIIILLLAYFINQHVLGERRWKIVKKLKYASQEKSE